MSKRFILQSSDNCVLTETFEPYAVIECATEEEFLFLQEALVQYKNAKNDSEALLPLSLGELSKMVGQSVYVEVSWGSSYTYHGPALVDRLWTEGTRLEYNGTHHYLLNKWYGQSNVWHWIAYPLVK